MKEAMKEVLDKYPALDGVFCTNANVSEMFLEVNKDNGENKVAMIGVDATSKQQEAIKNGQELGVLSQNPYAMGYQTMWAAIQSTAPKKETKIEKKFYLTLHGSTQKTLEAKITQIIYITDRQQM